ncbi:MAG: LemA family protein [Candidatus Aenigmatarchaeota archaeon]
MVIMIVAIIVAILVALFFIVTYNKIVRMERNIDKAWREIDIQLQRIAEQLPNLINILKGQAGFEKDVLTRISDAYARIAEAMRAPPTKENVGKVSSALGILMPIIYQLPQYPQLQSIQAFSKVMDELRVSIDKIAYSRQFYNDAVTEYNIFINSFPWLIVARMLGKSDKPLFEIGEEKRREITTKLETGAFTADLTKI